MSVNVNFKDYLSARAHAWVTGSVGATFNNTEYVKAEDSHDIRDCDESLPGDLCQQCVVAFNAKYGTPVAPEIPPTIDFTWYLHGGKPYEEREQWSRALGITVTDELLEKIGQPFYEVELACTLDTATGNVEIRSVK